MRLLDLIVNYDCNLGCDYCTISPQMRPRALSGGAVVRALRQGREKGCEAVSFTGGEPTLRPDLLGMIRMARQLGYTDIKVQTNGLLLASPANVQRFVDAGVTRVHLSIHTHEPRAYESLVRRPDTHPQMVAGLKNLVAAQEDHGLQVVADVILKTDTFPRLPEALRWLWDLGVRAADLWFVSLTDHNARNPGSMPRMTEVVPTMTQAFAWAREVGMKVRSLHVPRCLLGDDHPHAWDPADGGVLVVTPDATFELTTSKLTGQRHVPACEGCRFESVCPGLRDDYLQRYGDAEIVAARARPERRRR